MSLHTGILISYTEPVTLRQLAMLREVARQSLSISRAAAALHTSQPALSRQIQLLEEELGAPLIVRRRNRTLGFTDLGKSVLAAAHRLLSEADNIRAMAEEGASPGHGRLALVTSHLHARYTLLDPVAAFVRRYPDVQLELMETAHDNIPRLLEANEADLGITTELETAHPALVRLTGPAIRRALIVPKGHPLARKRAIALPDLAAYPLLGYNPQAHTGQVIAETLREHGILPRYLASVSNTDVVKAYVGRGLGIAVIPAIAVDPRADTAIKSRDVTHLFPQSVLTVSFRRNAYLRPYVIDFIRMVLPGLDPASIATA